jgi:hypothetical protein
LSTLASVIVIDLSADRPAASIPGRLFFASDTGAKYRDNGAAWDVLTQAQTIAAITHKFLTAFDAANGLSRQRSPRRPMSPGWPLRRQSTPPTRRIYRAALCLPPACPILPLQPSAEWSPARQPLTSGSTRSLRPVCRAFRSPPKATSRLPISRRTTSRPPGTGSRRRRRMTRPDIWTAPELIQLLRELPVPL